MIKLSRDLIANAVTLVLEAEPAVAGAYLFGSALGLCRPDSDIDVGIVIKPISGLSEEYYEDIANRISNRLQRIDGHAFDVVPLNIVNSIFAFRVAKTGDLIYQGCLDIVTDFVEQISRQYADNYPRYRQALRLITGA